MSGPPDKSWSLPYCSPVPADPRRRTAAAVLRVAAYVVLAGALITPVIQFEHETVTNLREAKAFDRAHPGWTPAVAARGGPARPKEHKGAIGRWRWAVRAFWGGRNIYALPPRVAMARRQAPPTATPRPRSGPVRTRPARLPKRTSVSARIYHRVSLHPNMPITVMLLTPFAYMPVWLMALTFSLLKVAVFVLAMLMIARLAGGGRRICDWVLGLGLVWSLQFVVGDIQHGNTNTFVLGAVVLHLWLYRRGRDVAAGAALALAICLKMTPALFVGYWLYQRNGRLLAGTLAAMVLLAAVVPAAAVGPSHYAALTQSWLENLIIPGLKGAWYPIHVNQSLAGVASRYLFGEPNRNGNIFWNPDDWPDYQVRQFGWIAFCSLSAATVKAIVRACQFVVVCLMAWAIGWRKLPREDGRRALHYGLVAVGMLLLNQRTWDHHAGVLLIADVAIWQAVAFGRFSRRARAWALGLMLAAGPLVWLAGGGTFKLIARVLGRGAATGSHWGDLAKAYGPTFYHFVLLLAAAVVLSVALRGARPPYAEQRQTL